MLSWEWLCRRMQELGIWVTEVGCWAPVMSREEMENCNLTVSPTYNISMEHNWCFRAFCWLKKWMALCLAVYKLWNKILPIDSTELSYDTYSMKPSQETLSDSLVCFLLHWIVYQIVKSVTRQIIKLFFLPDCELLKGRRTVFIFVWLVLSI